MPLNPEESSMTFRIDETPTGFTLQAVKDDGFGRVVPVSTDRPLPFSDFDSLCTYMQQTMMYGGAA